MTGKYKLQRISQTLQLIQEDRPLHDRDSQLQRFLLDFPIPRVLAQSSDSSKMVHTLDTEVV